MLASRVPEGWSACSHLTCCQAPRVVRGRCGWETQVVSFVPLGTPRVTGKLLLAASRFFRLYSRNSCAERSHFPERHCSPGTAACSRVLLRVPGTKYSTALNC